MSIEPHYTVQDLTMKPYHGHDRRACKMEVSEWVAY